MLQHLLWRFGFGPDTRQWADWAKLPRESWWTRMKADSAANPTHYDVVDNAMKGLLMGVGELGKQEKRELNKEEKKQIRKQSREDLKNLNLLWLNEMTDSKAQLREKMAFFWHGHFASRNINILYQQQLLQIVREHALGNFKDLLRSVSKSAAMLAFLNNQQNKKEHPNENFAREVMELFTLGRGNYTEEDIKEGARAFTGWGFRLNGEFVFKKRDHDTGEKTVLGKTGHFQGDDVLDILLEKRETAYFIARKLYHFLVNEHKAPHDRRIRELGDRFYDSGYQIMALLDAIALAPWFYDDENIGSKIKSPVELLVGLRRALPMQLDKPESQLVLQRALGQVLFYPPNVAGWPGGQTWIDSGSLLLRMRMPQMMYGQRDFDLNTKDDDDQQMGEGADLPRRQRIGAKIDWPAVVKLFNGLPDQDLDARLAAYCWQVAAPVPVEVLKKYTDRSSREQRIKTTIIQLMATPEYQLC
jgi:uncharacterized protein (DUF1800 family)